VSCYDAVFRQYCTLNVPRGLQGFVDALKETQLARVYVSVSCTHVITLCTLVCWNLHFPLTFIWYIYQGTNYIYSWLKVDMYLLIVHVVR